MKQSVRELLKKVVEDLIVSFAIGVLIFLFFCYWLGISPFNFDASQLHPVFFGSIVSGFVGLVAFLGAVAVFQISAQKTELLVLAEQSKAPRPHDVLRLHREIIQEYSPNLMTKSEYMNEWEERCKRYYTGWLPKYPALPRAMHENYEFEWEIRNRLMEFATLSFTNVAVALIFIIFAASIPDPFRSIPIFSVAALSIVVLVRGWLLVSRVVGFAIRPS